MDSILMALRRFMYEYVRGMPSRILSDKGEQLAAASMQLKAWDFDGVLKWAGKKGMEGT
jgi:hypothetical protein